VAKTRGYQFIEPEAVAKLGRFNLVAKAVVEGFVTGLHRSPFHGFSVEFSEHREYSPGDNLRDIDWKVLGKTDRYYVKRYEEETNLKAHILLDTSGSMGYKSNGMSKLEYGCYLAASLAYLMIRQQDSVGLVTFDESINTFMPPRSTTLHLNALLQTLEKLTPAKTTKVSKTFHDLAQTIKRRGLIVVISDLYDEPRDVMRGLRHFRHKRHEVIIFHLFDPAELDFRFRALTDFVDLETKERLQVDPKYVRQEYMRQVQEFIEAYKRDCSQGTIEYVVANTSTPYEMMLTSYLGKRKRLG